MGNRDTYFKTSLVMLSSLENGQWDSSEHFTSVPMEQLQLYLLHQYGPFQKQTEDDDRYVLQCLQQFFVHFLLIVLTSWPYKCYLRLFLH